MLDQQAGQLSTVQLIERQAEAWDKAKQARAWLELRGYRLREASALFDRKDFGRRLAGLPQEYVNACISRQRNTLVLLGGSLIFLAIGLLGTGVAYIGQLSDREHIVARAERIAADAARSAARAKLVEGVMAGLARPGVLDEATERDLKPGATFQECDTCPPMVVIPSGSFMMGSPDTEKGRSPHEGPQHKVTIARPFAVGKFEVTFSEWEACVASGGCTANESPRDGGWGKGTRPVINVSWDDARQYVEWISVKTGKPYRLLTEAEWEYAARGITDAEKPHPRYSWGEEAGEGNANCEGCKSQWDNKQTAPVGSFKPNDFGLHDMHGNVWEWVQDCYDQKAYASAPKDGTSATEPAKCYYRVLRGGSWFNDTRVMRAADRYRFGPDSRGDLGGFRVARVLFPART